ncbi:MAG TPA: hypothetical protein VGE12_15730 [Noviherbaspirillum sp.]
MEVTVIGWFFLSVHRYMPLRATALAKKRQVRTGRMGRSQDTACHCDRYRMALVRA